MNIRGHSGMT